MTTILRVLGADFSANPIGFIPPVSSGLEGWWYLGDSMEKSLRNLAPGKPDATPFGAPGVQAGYLEMKGMTNYLRTSIAETASYTLLAVAASDETFAAAATQPTMISSQNNSTTSGARMFLGSGATAAPVARLSSFASALNDSSVSAMYGDTLDVSNASAFRFYATALDAGVARYMWDKTGATSKTTPITRTRTLNVGGRTYDIGSAFLGGQTATQRMAFAAIYSRALTDAEVTTVYQAVKAFLTKRSITV